MSRPEAWVDELIPGPFLPHYLASDINTVTLQTFRAPPEETTMDDFLRGEGKVQDELFKEWEVTKSGLVASNGIGECKLTPVW